MSCCKIVSAFVCFNRAYECILGKNLRYLVALVVNRGSRVHYSLVDIMVTYYGKYLVDLGNS